MMKITRSAQLFLTLALIAGLLTACAPGDNSKGSPTSGSATGMVETPAQQASATSQPPAATDTQPAAADTVTAAPEATQSAATDLHAATQPSTIPNTGDVPTDTVTTFPDPALFTWQQVVTELVKPTDLNSPADGTNRLFVLEQPGRIRIIQDGSLLPQPFLDITAKVGSQGSEQGLLGIAFHPQYAQNGYIYINYTNTKGDTVVARYTVSPDPNVADPGSEMVLLTQDQPYPNHNGGSMAFGPDGYLYMGLGDGGSGGDPRGNGQNVNTWLGKILRVDVNNGEPYAIPVDNPFANGGGKPEIWAYGLRNPWRFSFDRLTGDMYVADVGQNIWEEVNFQPAGAAGGANYGWNFMEGNHSFQGNPPADANFVPPVFEYQHPTGCSVSGGYVYRGQALPEMRGIYLFSDFCSGTIWGLLRAADGNFQPQELFQSEYNVTSFGQDQQGEIYLLDQASGGVYRLSKK